MKSRFAQKTTLLLLLALMLGGCTFQLIYPRLPFLIGWQLDSYLDLSDEQEDWLDQRLRQHLSSHRKTELPRYVEFTQKLQTTFSQDAIDEQTLINLESESHQLYLGLAQQFLDDAVELISGLSDEQVQKILQKQQEESTEADEEFRESDADDRAERRFENTIDDLTELVGRLTSSQRQLVNSFSEQRTDSYLLAKPTRERWRQVIAEALQNRQDKIGLRDQLKLLVEQPERLRDADYAAHFQRNTQLRHQMQVALFATLNTKQRAHLQKQLLKWQDDFSELMTQSE